MSVTTVRTTSCAGELGGCNATAHVIRLHNEQVSRDYPLLLFYDVYAIGCMSKRGFSINELRNTRGQSLVAQSHTLTATYLTQGKAFNALSKHAVRPCTLCSRVPKDRIVATNRLSSCARDAADPSNSGARTRLTSPRFLQSRCQRHTRPLQTCTWCG